MKALTCLKNLVNSKDKMPPSCPIEVRNLCKDACERWIRNQDHHSVTSAIEINPIELPAEVETDVEAKTPSSLDASEFDEVSISSVDTIESLQSSVEEEKNVSPKEWEYLTRSFTIRKNSGVWLVHIAKTLSFLAQLVKE